MKPMAAILTTLAISFLVSAHVATAATTVPAPTAQAVKTAVKTSVPALNAKVLAYAVNHRGRKIGDGICHTLVNQALVSAGARPMMGHASNGDEIYGRTVPRLSEVLPGDILELRNAVFSNYKMHWHVAIVARVAGSKVTIMEQNWDNDKDDGKRVRSFILDFSKRNHDAKIHAFRPVPRSNG
jgi:hypothetical protein